MWLIAVALADDPYQDFERQIPTGYHGTVEAVRPVAAVRPAAKRARLPVVDPDIDASASRREILARKFLARIPKGGVIHGRVDVPPRENKARAYRFHHWYPGEHYADASGLFRFVWSMDPSHAPSSTSMFVFEGLVLPAQPYGLELRGPSGQPYLGRAP